MSEWTKYGQWRHPITWWQIALNKYLESNDVAKFNSNPIVIEVDEFNIKYHLNNSDDVLLLSKKDIMEFLNY